MGEVYNCGGGSGSGGVDVEGVLFFVVVLTVDEAVFYIVAPNDITAIEQFVGRDGSCGVPGVWCFVVHSVVVIAVCGVVATYEWRLMRDPTIYVEGSYLVMGELTIL